MFGTYRTLLAVMVIFLHLGGLPVIGAYAVFGFYILSGYLMTLIMQRNYGYSRDGIKKYAVNRFLRIYPIYWLASIMSLGLILVLGESLVREFNHSMYIPSDPVSIVKNVLLLFPFRYDPRLTPPAWALTVELFFYVCIGLGLSKTRGVSILWLCVSILYTVVVNVRGLAWEYKYFVIPAASLPFSTGAVIYHYRDILVRYTDRILGNGYAPYILFAMVILNWAVGNMLGTLRGIGFYINYLLCAVILISLSKRTALPFISRNFDKLMGDFSYPIYLIHYQVGLMVLVAIHAIGFSVRYPEPVFAIISLPFIFIVAWILSRYVELPIEIIRSRVKKPRQAAQ